MAYFGNIHILFRRVTLLNQQLFPASFPLCPCAPVPRFYFTALRPGLLPFPLSLCP